MQTLGAPHPSRGRGRALTQGEAGGLAAGDARRPVSRCTVAGSSPLGDESEAKAWLKKTGGDPKARADFATAALAVLNRGLEALREEAEDRLVAEASFHHALAVRIGFGTGEQIADGQWTDAVELPPTPTPRHHDLEAQRRAALRLAGTRPRRRRRRRLVSPLRLRAPRAG